MSKFERTGATLIVALAVLVIVGSFIAFILPMITNSKVNLWIGDGIFKASVALDEKGREKGWNDKANVESAEALIMVYPNEDKVTVSVKDMKVTVDLVWLDSNKKIVYLAKDISPDSPQMEIASEKSAKYVIELAGGMIDSKSINIGSTAVFDIEKEAK